jgi:hypothetical protein
MMEKGEIVFTPTPHRVAMPIIPTILLPLCGS